MDKNIIVEQMNTFKRVYKKLHDSQQIEVDGAIKAIIENPRIGEEKKGNLAGIFVYKFKIQHQEFLLAYEWNQTKRILMGLGTHETFYRNLSRRC